MTRLLTRLPLLLLAVALTPLPAPAQVQCGARLRCGVPLSLTRLATRVPHVTYEWTSLNFPPAPFDQFLQFDLNEYRSLVQEAMDSYGVINAYVPQDVAADFDPDWSISWVPRSDLLRLEGGELEPGGMAVMVPVFAGATDPCVMTAASIYLAFNPVNAFSEPQCYGDKACMGNCVVQAACEFRTLDFLSVITHELGHALGLAHINTPQATMGPEVFENAIWYRDWLPCEGEYIGQMYHENFGPAVVGGFEAEVVAGAVRVGWSTDSEVDCAGFKVTHWCDAGGSRVIADTIPCAGEPSTYVVWDTTACSEGTYALALWDRRAGGAVVEVLKAMCPSPGIEGSGAPAAVGGDHEMRRESAMNADGFGDKRGAVVPGDVVTEYFSRIAAGDWRGAAWFLADGFQTVSKSGLRWGAGVDRVLEHERRLRWRGPSAVDSIAVGRPLWITDQAGGRKLMRCDIRMASDGDPSLRWHWEGRVEALLEQSPGTGWVMRELREVE